MHDACDLKTRAALTQKRDCSFNATNVLTHTNLKANFDRMNFRFCVPLAICSENPFVCEVAGRRQNFACKKPGI